MLMLSTRSSNRRICFSGNGLDAVDNLGANMLIVDRKTVKRS